MIDRKHLNRIFESVLKEGDYNKIIDNLPVFEKGEEEPEYDPRVIKIKAFDWSYYEEAGIFVNKMLAKGYKVWIHPDCEGSDTYAFIITKN